MATKTVIIERKSAYSSEDSPRIDARLIDNFIVGNPDAKIISVLHSGVKHLLIVYETNSVIKAQSKTPTDKSNRGKASI